MGPHHRSEPTQDVHVVLVSIPAYGHIRPLRSLTQSLVARGYSTTFITGNFYKYLFDNLPGVEFVQLRGKADIDPDRFSEHFPERKNYEGPARVIFDLENIFIGPLDDQFEVLQNVLQRPELLKKKVVVVGDPSFMGCQPMLLDSPKARRVPFVGIGHFPIMILSKDTAPFGPGLPSQGEEKNIEMNNGAIQMFAGVDALLRRVLKTYDCRKELPSKFFCDNWTLNPDIYCQLCPPELEPPRRDLPANVRFSGTLLGANDKKPAPGWFRSFVEEDKSGHPLILVTSGTVATADAHDLIIPTIEACRDLPVRVVVCAVRASLPADFQLPANARVATWIAFEEVFPYTSLVVSNGGYSGVTQTLAAGIPMIVAGTTEDKTETCLRAEMTGAAINLRTGAVTKGQMSDALHNILHDKTYKEKALQIKLANEWCDALGSIIGAVEELAQEFYS